MEEKKREERNLNIHVGLLRGREEISRIFTAPNISEIVR